MNYCSVIIYILALAFQIAGAVLLIIKFWGNTQNRIIETYYPGTGVASNDGDDNAILEVARIRECVKEIYANRAAFIYIAIGYAISIFGDKGITNNWVILLFVIFTTIALIGVERLIANGCAKYFYKEDIKISYDDLPNHIDKTMSTKDIDQMIKDTFGN